MHTRVVLPRTVGAAWLVHTSSNVANWRCARAGVPIGCALGLGSARGRRHVCAWDSAVVASAGRAEEHTRVILGEPSAGRVAYILQRKTSRQAPTTCFSTRHTSIFLSF